MFSEAEVLWHGKEFLRAAELGFVHHPSQLVKLSRAEVAGLGLVQHEA